MPLSNKFLEKLFTQLLYILMLAILILIFGIMEYPESKLFSPSLLIGLSALTASLAMSRSVYATKISDEAKLNRELLVENLDIYVEIQRIINLAIKRKHTHEHIEKLKTIAIRAEMIISDTDIDEALKEIINNSNNVPSSDGIRSFDGIEYERHTDIIEESIYELSMLRETIRIMFLKYLR